MSSAFVGRQLRPPMGDESFFLDLLFYHLKLRCYVVIELKAVAFDPAFVGQINLYLSAVDDQLRHSDDQPTNHRLVESDAGEGTSIGLSRQFADCRGNRSGA
jgi:hypothetical protein